MELKCCPCTDQLIADGGSYPETDLPDACTIVPLVQTFDIGGGQQIAAPVALPVCFDCREKQLGKVSKQGLVTA
jgi:hypothetical protein